MSWEDYTQVDDKSIPYRIFPPERMAGLLGDLGIDENTSLAVYGDADSTWGGEGWICWLFSYLGHHGKIMLVDGGIQAWSDLGLPLTGDIGVKPLPRIYHADPHQELDIQTKDIEAGSGLQIVDTRSIFERLRGSIPGSVHINWTLFYTGDHRQPLSPDKVKQLLTDNGIKPDQPVVYYCTGGIRSAYAWTVHQLSGLPPARNYEGGMVAWKIEH